MNARKEKLISEILSLCPFSDFTQFMINYKEKMFFQSNTHNHSIQLFDKLMGKHNITKYRLAQKLSSNSNFDYHYSKLRNIGNIINKKNKEGKTITYKRKIQEQDVLALKKLIPYDKINHQFSTLTDIQFSYKITFIIDYLNQYTEEQLDLSSFSEDIITEVLQHLEPAILIELLVLISSNSYLTYFPNNESIDAFETFIDNTDIIPLFFLFQNADILLSEILTIEHLFHLLHGIGDTRLHNILKYLKHQHTSPNLSPQSCKIKNTVYPQVVDYSIFPNNVDEHYFRYHILAPLLEKLNSDSLESIMQCIVNITPLKWEIIRAVYRVYSNPHGKSVETMLNKF